MRTTIDTAGRVVIPKSLRERVGLMGGTEVDIVERDGLLELAPAQSEIRIVERDGVHVAVADPPLPPLPAEVVRQTLERVRDRR